MAATKSRSGTALRVPAFDQLLEGEAQGDEGAGDGGGARAAVGLDDVAVDPDGALAELSRSVTARRERPMRRWISWVRPEARPLLTSRGVRVEGGAREHAVFARDPAFAAVAQEGGNRFFDRGGADDAGVADFDERGAFGGVDKVGEDGDRPKLIGGAVVGAKNHLVGL